MYRSPTTRTRSVALSLALGTFSLGLTVAAPRAAHAQWGYSYSSGRVAVVETENRAFSRNLRIGAGVSAILSPGSSFNVAGHVFLDLAPIAELALLYSHPVLSLESSGGQGHLTGEAGIFLHANSAARQNNNVTLQQSSYQVGNYVMTDRTSVNAPMTVRSAWGGRLGGLFLWTAHEEKPEGMAATRYEPMRAGGYAGFGHAIYFNSSSYIGGWGQRSTTGFFRWFIDGVFTPVVQQGSGAPTNAPVWGYGARAGVEGTVGRNVEAGYRVEAGWNRVGGWYLLGTVSIDLLFTFDR